MDLTDRVAFLQLLIEEHLDRGDRQPVEPPRAQAGNQLVEEASSSDLVGLVVSCAQDHAG